MLKLIYLVPTIISSFRQSCAVLVVLALGFFLLEPAVSLGFTTTASSQFTIGQVIGVELSMYSPPSNITLAPALGGVAGGTSNGSTQFVVRSNDHAGYQVVMAASSSQGMMGTASTTAHIPWYATSTVPDYNMNVPPGLAGFAFTVESSSTSPTDVVQIFHENGSACNSGTTHTNPNQCWLGASSTSAFTIINRSTVTLASGATTTIKFRVIINGMPTPVLPDDTYTATTTVTATSN